MNPETITSLDGFKPEESPEEAQKKQQQRQMRAAREDILFKIVSKEGLERLHTVEIGHPSVADKAKNLILNFVQQRKLSPLVPDSEVKKILEGITKSSSTHVKETHKPAVTHGSMKFGDEDSSSDDSSSDDFSRRRIVIK
ncbi:PDCD5-like protein [Aduncisulcus paluster]|uniref:PDCD5-like protein n=1 Tax=Aduncisulcus paluster TaxID=2918883 RepID=A0ABQ5K7X9_9EUKA|nr:PDCD5-like protein [Aduncisulcus paluster]